MTGWWSARTLRERALLGGAAAAILAALFLQFLFFPAFRAREDAAQDLTRATGTVALLNRMPGQTAAGAAPSAPLIAQWAAEAGLELRAVGGEGAFAYQAVSQSPEALFRWIARVESETGLRVWQADVRSGIGGGVDAAVIFSSGAMP